MSKTVCVVGAGGFVGRSLVQALSKEGAKIKAISRKRLESLEQLGVVNCLCDISESSEKLISFFEGVDTVFHTAAKVDMWGRYPDFYKSNVVGTRNVIDACLKAGVKNLVYTSSPSVVADGTDLNGVNESYPIAKNPLAFYSKTKAIAESQVLAANCSSLRSLALRPHLIFGPGDRHFLPTVIERAKSGRLLIIGDGKNIVDVCFIEDCVKAHLLAEKALEDNDSARGRAYFISQGQPLPLWEFINRVLELNSLPRLERKLSKSNAMFLARIFEIFSRIPALNLKPLFTRFLVSEMSTNHYFSIQSAKEKLGFTPRYSVEDALRKTFGDSR